jgi:hypothetical protein
MATASDISMAVGSAPNSGTTTGTMSAAVLAALS